MDGPMDRVPVEIISLICNQLCFHCCHPGVMPNADIATTRESKAALASLARTSKRIEKIARPILYHYFSMGLVYIELRRFSFGRFMRTLLERPDLAELVKTLQLKCAGTVQGYHDLDNIEPRISEPLEPNFGITWKLAEIRTGPKPQGGCCSDSYDHYRRHRWLEECCILLTPNLESLILARSGNFSQIAESFASFHGRGQKPRSLQKLKTLILFQDYGSENIEAYSGILLNAPSLQTFHYLPSGWQGSSDHVRRRDQSEFDRVFAGHTLASVKKLMLPDPTVEGLQRLLPLFPNLEEFDVLWGGHTVDYPALGALANSTRVKTLRKLRFANFFGYRRSGRSYEVQLRWVRYGTLPPGTLTAFENLEELTLDQAAFHHGGFKEHAAQGGAAATPAGQDGQGGKSDQRLVDMLPSSLSHLYVVYVYRSMLEDLEELAGVHRERFPALRTVSISLAVSMEGARRAEVVTMKQRAGDLFRGTSVRLIWGPLSRWGGVDAMLRPATALGDEPEWKEPEYVDD